MIRLRLLHCRDWMLGAVGVIRHRADQVITKLYEILHRH